jgi:beta-phosphoglucomutase-like phosphatase (HAD superfamily)
MAVDGILVALDGVLVELDRTDAPPPLAGSADDTDRALHALATDRALLASITLRGLSTAPDARSALNVLTAVAPVALVSAFSRSVTAAVLESTGWRDCFRTIVTADDVPPELATEVRRAALARWGRPIEPSRFLAVEAHAAGIAASRAIGMAVVCGTMRERPPTADFPSVATLTELTAHRVRAIVHEVHAVPHDSR